MAARKQIEERGKIYAQYRYSFKGIEVGDKLEALDYCAKGIFAYQSFCEHCKSNFHLSFSCKFHPNPIVASYNRDCYIFDYVETIEELMLYFRTSELMTRVKELSLQHKEVLKHMGMLENIHNWCISNNLHNAPFIKDYEKRAAASQASMLQEHNLIKESEEIIERWEKNIQGVTFQEVCLGDKPEKEHGDEGGKGRLPTTPTDHGKFLDTINAQLDDHLSYLCSIRTFMEPIETMLECSPPEDIVRVDVSKLFVRHELDIGIVPDVPPMTPLMKHQLAFILGMR